MTAADACGECGHSIDRHDECGCNRCWLDLDLRRSCRQKPSDILAARVAAAERARAEVEAKVRAVLDEKAFYIPSEYAEDALIYVDHVRAALSDAAAPEGEGDD